MKFVTFLLALAYTATVAMAETKECEGVFIQKFIQQKLEVVQSRLLHVGLELQ